MFFLFFSFLFFSHIVDETTLDEHLASSNPTIYYDTEPCSNPSVAAATKLVPTLSLEALPQADKTVIPLCNQYELEGGWTQQHPIPLQPTAFVQTQQLSPTVSLRQSQHFDVYNVTHNLQPVISSHSQLIPPPPQSETVTYHELTPDHSRNLSASHITFPCIPMAIVDEAIRCSTCRELFNRAVICHNFLIQLNRPIQCACGCVICTLCYHHQGGCRQHHVLSSRGPVNTIANNLASCPELKNLGDWDLELDANDPFKKEVNAHVQQIIMGVKNPGIQELQQGRCIYLTSLS